MSEWKKVKIGDFLKRKRIPIQLESDKEYKLITIKLYHKGVYLRGNKKGSEIHSNMYKVSKGDFILSGIDARNGAFGIVPDSLDGAIVTNDFWYFDIDELIIKKEFFLWLTSTPVFLDACQKASMGETQRIRLQKDAFFNYQIKCPSIEYQDEFLARINPIIEKIKIIQSETEKQSEYAKLLRQNILQQAIEGKLTADWRKQNPIQKGNPDYDAEALFEQIQKEHNKSIKIKSRSSNTIQDKLDDDFDLNIPQSWLFIRLSELGILERGKSKHRPRNDPSLFTDGKYPFVQTGDVAQSKYFGYEIQPASKFYNDFGLAQSKMWCAGTLCITIAANIAETGFLTYDACFPDSVVGFTPFIEGVFSTFVRYYIDSIKLILEKYAPATAQKNINLGILETLKIPLPPLAEQKEIVKQVEKHLQTVSYLENQITEREQLTKQLMQSILKDAFEEK